MLKFFYSICSNFSFLCRYGKTKDAFGWPEEIEEIQSCQPTSAPITTINNEADNTIVSPAPLSSLDKYVNRTLISYEVHLV